MRIRQRAVYPRIERIVSSGSYLSSVGRITLHLCCQSTTLSNTRRTRRHFGKYWLHGSRGTKNLQEQWQKTRWTSTIHSVWSLFFPWSVGRIVLVTFSLHHPRVRIRGRSIERTHNFILHWLGTTNLRGTNSEDRTGIGWRSMQIDYWRCWEGLGAEWFGLVCPLLNFPPVRHIHPYRGDRSEAQPIVGWGLGLQSGKTWRRNQGLISTKVSNGCIAITLSCTTRLWSALQKPYSYLCTTACFAAAICFTSLRCGNQQFHEKIHWRRSWL